MAKVSNTKVGKAQGASSATGKSNSDIIAVRDGSQRSFKKILWDELPPEKEGWKEVKEAPKEPETKVDTNPPAKGGKANQSKKGEDPKKSTQGGDDNTKEPVTKVLTQEDLDLNPDLAEQGLKVGDTVEFTPEEDDED